MKQLKIAALALLAALTFTACDDDDATPPTVIDPVETVQTNAYIINQGNAYGGIDGTIDRLLCTATDTTYTADAFTAANGQSLGAGPQNAVVYGSRLYVPMNGEKMLWVLNAQTLQIIKKIETSEPMGVCAAGGNVFVSNYDGYVSCIDTLSLTEKAKVAVGPNPEQLVASGANVYVSVSDGMNSTNGYANGYKLAVIDAKTGNLRKHIAVGVNPGPIVAAANGNIYVVSRGNYSDILATVQCVNPSTETVTNIGQGSLIAASGDNLYVINSVTNWTSGVTTNSFDTYSTATNSKVSSFIAESDSKKMPAQPSFIDVDPKSGAIYIGSDKSAFDYDKQGYVYMYGTNGKLLHRFDAGIHPYAIAFRQ